MRTSKANVTYQIIFNLNVLKLKDLCKYWKRREFEWKYIDYLKNKIEIRVKNGCSIFYKIIKFYEFLIWLYFILHPIYILSNKSFFSAEIKKITLIN